MCRATLSIVMPGLDPGIHTVISCDDRFLFWQFEAQPAWAPTRLPIRCSLNGMDARGNVVASLDLDQVRA